MVIQREEPVQVLSKKRVLYIGSSVPLETTEGLEAVQQPLRDRYPVGENAELQGIDSWLSILSSGIQVQYVDDPDTVVYFPISSLTLCAAVRPVNAINGATGEVMAKFVSLNSDIAAQNAKNPAIFTAITRRVKGRKVLECHGFLCASDKDALEVVKCTSIADQNKRQNGTVRNGQPPYRVINGPSVDRSRPGSYRIVNGAGPPSMVNGSVNRPYMMDRQPPARQSVRLSAGEQFPTQVEDVPQEFFDSPPPQGYFYRPNNVQAKNFKVEKREPQQQPPLSARSSYLQPAAERISPPSPPSPPVEPVPPPPKPPTPVDVPQPSPPSPPQPQQGPVPEPQPNVQEQRRPPPMENGFRPRHFMPPRPGAPFYPPPPPYMRPPYYYPPPPPMARPRFFSPPPYMRGPPYPYGPYPYGPYPQYFRRRRPKRRESESPKSKSSRSGSRHSQHSRHSSRKSGKDNEETERKRIPNADLDSESDFSFRPRTPPRDYDNMKGEAEPSRKERMSRREEYEKRRHKPKENHDRSPPHMMYSGFRPYYMYQPQAFGPYMPPDMSRFPRSNSVPPHLRYSSKERKNEKKKNKKKNKGKNKQQRGGPPNYGPYGPREDVSMESASMMGGYASEISPGTYPMDGYYYNPHKPPRDFRREKNQFLSEKSFSRRLMEEQRMSKGKKQDYYPTAYELNDAGAEERLNEPDFTMY